MFWLLSAGGFSLIKETYEKQIRLLTSENEKGKRNSIQIDEVVTQLKRENEELQQKVRFDWNDRNDPLDLIVVEWSKETKRWNVLPRI